MAIAKDGVIQLSKGVRLALVEEHRLVSRLLLLGVIFEVVEGVEALGALAVGGFDSVAEHALGESEVVRER